MASTSQPRDYGTSLRRRTETSVIYKATGKLGAVEILLGHAEIDSAMRYFGVDVEDALALTNRTDG